MTIPTITKVMPSSPAAPSRSDRATFAARGDAMMAHIEDLPDDENELVTQINATVAGMNTAVDDVEADKTAAETAADNATSAANAYVWSDGGSSRAFSVGETMIWTNGFAYRCLTATSAGESPETHPAKWRNLHPGVYDIKDHGTVTANTDIDVEESFVHKITVNADISFTFSNFPSGKHVTIVLILTDSGDRTITWPSAVKWADGAEPEHVPNARNRFVFASEDGGTTIDGGFCGGGFA